jgi:biotin-dependent carboxylase-like uncharacterized protein
VEAVGPQAVIVDRGRPGWAHVGVPPSGAVDGPAHDLAQRLVENAPDAAGLEVLLGGLTLRCDGAATVALTGPPAPMTVRRAGAVRPVGSHRAVRLADGDRLVVGAPDGGLRGYLAVDGGVAVAPVLGSRSTDVLSGLGPAPLEVGSAVLLGPPGRSPAGGPVPSSVPPDAIRLVLHLGPRDDWVADATAALRGRRWTVTSSSDRVGVRLDGPPLERAAEHRNVELPSEGLVTGAVQVPPDGRPVVFLTDHPTTGGYPVVGVVDPAALPALAQARPGSAVAFRPVSSPRSRATISASDDSRTPHSDAT